MRICEGNHGVVISLPTPCEVHLECVINKYKIDLLMAVNMFVSLSLSLSIINCLILLDKLN